MGARNTESDLEEGAGAAEIRWFRSEIWGKCTEHHGAHLFVRVHLCVCMSMCLKQTSGEFLGARGRMRPREVVVVLLNGGVVDTFCWIDKLR